MKKLILLFFIVIIGFSYFSFNLTGLLGNVELTNKNNIGVYASGDESKKIFDNCFAHGFVNEIFGITPEIFYSYSQDGEVLGEFFETDLNNFDLNVFAKKFGLIIVKTSQVGQTHNIYASSAMLPYKLNNENFNVQIAITGKRVTVASPIIMGSF